MNNVSAVSKKTSTFSVFCFIASYYSRVLDEQLTVSQTKAIVCAQCAFIAVVMPFDFGMLYRAVAVAWFVVSMLRCRTLMRGGEA